MTINEFSGIITALSTISMAVVAGYALHTMAQRVYRKEKNRTSLSNNEKCI